MSHVEFMEWIAYYQLEPWGPVREDMRAGIVAAQVHNSNLTRRNRHQARKASDFVLFDPFKTESNNSDAQVLAAFGGKPK